MPEPAAINAAGVVSGILYVFGLWPNLSLLAYDPVSDTWARKTALPTHRDWAAGAVVNGILYVIGGRGGKTDNGLEAFATVEAYDPATNMWTTKAAMPTPRFGAAAGVVNGIVYVVGGFSGEGRRVLSTVEAYNPVTNTWTTKRAMPTPRAGVAAGATDAMLYILGGEGENKVTFYQTLEAYDPIRDTWTTEAPMPTDRSSPVVGVIDGRLYVAGGDRDIKLAAVGQTRYDSNNPPWLATLEAYDPATNSWTTKTAMRTGRTWAVGGVVNGILYVAGGHGYQLWMTTLEAYNPGLDTLGEARHQATRGAPAKYLP